MPDPTTIQSFIDRWQASGAAERTNFPEFIIELCDLLDLPRPDPATPDDSRNAYIFERAVPLPEGRPPFLVVVDAGLLPAKSFAHILANLSTAASLPSRWPSRIDSGRFWKGELV